MQVFCNSFYTTTQAIYEWDYVADSSLSLSLSLSLALFRSLSLSLTNLKQAYGWGVIDGGWQATADSHEELWRRRVVAGGASFSEASSGEFLTLDFVGVSLSHQPGNLLLELFYLLDELGLLVLQQVFLLHTLVPARLSVAPVLQGSPLLLQADHVVLGEASEVPVEFPHRHADELIVGEPVLGQEALVMRGTLDLLRSGGDGGSRGAVLLVVAVMLMVPVAVA